MQGVSHGAEVVESREGPNAPEKEAVYQPSGFVHRERQSRSGGLNNAEFCLVRRAASDGGGCMMSWSSPCIPQVGFNLNPHLATASRKKQRA